MTTAALLTLCVKTYIWGAKGYEFKSQFPLPDACIHLAGNNAACLDVYSHGSLQQRNSISLGDTPVSCEIILWILQGMLSEGRCWELQDTGGKASKITTFGTGFQTPLCLQTPEPFCISWVSLGKYKGSQLTFPYYQAQKAIGSLSGDTSHLSIQLVSAIMDVLLESRQGEKELSLLITMYIYRPHFYFKGNNTQ